MRCWWSYALSLVGIVHVRHMPTFVSVEPANICQLHCPECPVGRHEHTADSRHLLSQELFEQLLSQVAPTAHTMQFYFQGEPLLHPLLPTMIAQAHEAGLYTIVSTNAQALDPALADALVRSGLDRIIVSIDGFSQASYAAYRVGGDLQKALDGLRALQLARTRHQRHIRIELQVLRLRTNEHEWHWIQQHYKELGATHLVFKTAQLYDYQQGHALMPTDERYARYRLSREGHYVLKHSHASRLAPYPFSPCYRLWSGCVITTSGTVLPCCYDKAHEHALGDITHHSLRDIFLSDKAQLLRQQVLRQRHALPTICHNCNH